MAKRASVASANVVVSVPVVTSACVREASTVFAAFNHYAGDDKDIAVWPYNGHEGGQAFQAAAKLAFVRDRL